MEKPKLFVSEGCGACAELKKRIKDLELENYVNEINIRNASESDLNKIVEGGYASVPVMITETGKICNGVNDAIKCIISLKETH